jgi:hypothetical protein
MVGIAVAFTLWSQISSCNAQADAKARDAQLEAQATPESARSFCEGEVREHEGFRTGFSIISSEAVRHGRITFKVRVDYEYLNTATGARVQDSDTCSLQRRSSGGWRSGMRF